jgi:hypothetical protein
MDAGPDGTAMGYCDTDWDCALNLNLPGCECDTMRCRCTAAPADAQDASGACKGDADCPTSHSCTKDSDCDAGFSCGYRIADGCGAVRSCQMASDPGNDVPIYYCGCDGTAVLTTLGYTYTLKPVSSFANDQSLPICSPAGGVRD